MSAVEQQLQSMQVQVNSLASTVAALQKQVASLQSIAKKGSELTHCPRKLKR